MKQKVSVLLELLHYTVEPASQTPIGMRSPVKEIMSIVVRMQGVCLYIPLAVCHTYICVFLLNTYPVFMNLGINIV